MSSEKTLSFEEAMEQLETIVERLEEGDVPLEEAISKFIKMEWNFQSFAMKN